MTLTNGLSLRTIFITLLLLLPPHLLATTASITKIQTRNRTRKVRGFILLSEAAENRD
uniref:Putative venom protein n=1 Tax=Mesobuthus gibbosus TaxID=123226 RepID=A0A059UEE8_MESGB|nr:putative venom protein [Mesobuthus gibbosus]